MFLCTYLAYFLSQIFQFWCQFFFLLLVSVGLHVPVQIIVQIIFSNYFSNNFSFFFILVSVSLHVSVQIIFQIIFSNYFSNYFFYWCYFFFLLVPAFFFSTGVSGSSCACSNYFFAWLGRDRGNTGRVFPPCVCGCDWRGCPSAGWCRRSSCSGSNGASHWWTRRSASVVCTAVGAASRRQWTEK